MLLRILLAACAALSLPLIAVAERLPQAEARVQELLERLRNSGDPIVILDYVDWESAFQDLRGSERVRMGVHTPRELYLHMHSALQSAAPPPPHREEIRYQVLGSDRAGARAVVRFEALKGSERKRQQIELIFRNGEWYLPSPDLKLASPQ